MNHQYSDREARPLKSTYFPKHVLIDSEKVKTLSLWPGCEALLNMKALTKVRVQLVVAARMIVSLSTRHPDFSKRGTDMKVGVSMFLNSDVTNVAAVARRAEEVGFDSFWLPEHTIIPVHSDTRFAGSPDGSIPSFMADMGDPFIGLAMASATTSRIKLGTSICLVPEHNPLVQAKQIAALDYHSGGRFIFGIGAGWLREETEVMGGDFDHRWTQTREAIEVMKALWTQDEVEYHGRYYDFPAVKVFPKPAQNPHPPVFLGGNARNVFRRVVAYGDGWFPVRVSPEEVQAARATLDELADSAGRDPKSIQICVYGVGDRDTINRMEDAGADMVVHALGSDAGDGALSAVEKLAEELLG